MWIRLKGIQVYGYHGVHAHEREHGARFEIDVDVRADLDRAAETDDLNQTIDYVKLQQAVHFVSTTKRYHLLEAFADAIVCHVLTNFPVDEAVVRVRKPGAAVGGVLESVEVEAHRFAADVPESAVFHHRSEEA